MKLLFITNNFPPISCGVGDYTYNLAREFVNKGSKVAVICRTDKRISEHWNKTENGIEVYDIGGNWTYKDWKKVLGCIGKLSLDHVIFQYVAGSYNPFAVPWLSIYFFKKAKHLPVNVVTTFHETYVRYNWSHPKYLYVAIGQRIIARAIAKNSHGLVTSINRYEQQLKRWNNNVTLVPVGSNILPFPISEEELVRLRQTIAPGGGAILCTFGNRNHQGLLNLFAQLLEKKPNCVLLIVGKLSIPKNTLPKAIISRIYVTGFLESPEVFKHLKASDIFINVTNFKPGGGSNNKSGALAAAFAAGLPIMGSLGEMSNQLLINKSKIQWFSFEKSLEVIDLISILLDQKEKRKQLSLASLEFFKNFLSWQQIRKAYELILEK